MVDGCASISVMMPLKEGWQKEDIVLFSLHKPLYQISRISFCKGIWIYGALGNWFLNKSNLHLVLQYSTLTVVRHSVWITPQCHLDPMIEVHATYNFQLNSVMHFLIFLPDCGDVHTLSPLQLSASKLYLNTCIHWALEWSTMQQLQVWMPLDACGTSLCIGDFNFLLCSRVYNGPMSIEWYGYDG